MSTAFISSLTPGATSTGLSTSASNLQGRRSGPIRGGATVPRYRFLFGWALGWAVVGMLVGTGITFTLERDPGPIFVMSVVFAEVVGFTALVSARVVFPLFSRLPFAVRLVLQSLTLFSGTLFGSVAILWFQPLFSLARFRTVVVIVLVNASIAVVVGIAVHTYDSMRRQIEASFEVLRQRDAMDRDLEIAREVQRELLPRSAPTVSGLELTGVCIPAVGVGGDYFDFLPFAQDKLGIVIADVSGKGIPAALLMAGVQASVRSLALPDVPPGEVNRKLNDLLHESTSDSRYATLFFALYDTDARRLTYSNAGHFPPLLMTSNGTFRLTTGGLPIGILSGSRYGEDRRVLEVGDILALFTDGVVEAPNRSDEEFGEERLVGLLTRHRDSALDEIVRVVMDDLARWSEGMPRHDDITLVLARAV